MKFIAILPLVADITFAFNVGKTVVPPVYALNQQPRTATKQRSNVLYPLPFGTRTSRLGLASETTTAIQDELAIPSSKSIVGRAVFLLPHNAKDVKSKFGSYSPSGNPSILEAAEQLQKKVTWFSDEQIEADLVVLPDSDEDFPSVRKKVVDADALIAFNMERDVDVGFLNDIFDERRKLSKDDEKTLCHYALDGPDASPSPLCGPHDPRSPSLASSLIPWSGDASGRRLERQMSELFDRWTSDDFTYGLMLFFDRYFAPIDWVKHSIDATWEKGAATNAKEFYNMITKCGDCVAKCVADEKCKECLDALTAVDTSDQVASYRTIVSYESELLRDFSFCILQKNNIFDCDATIPTRPAVAPLATFRGEPLTRRAARSILVGHLEDVKALVGGEKTSVSWKVAAGANVAYDQFPSQNQIFYEAADGGGMWYDPVFRVETIDGRNVWAKRHYRVRDGPAPGTFRFSVLDNGVTSDEFWTIVDVADDLSYIIFHYAGAAGAVGQRYLGGLLCTSDGSLPSELERERRIYPKLREAGISPWELFVVDNSVDSPGAIDAGPPPLDFYRKDVLKAKSKLKN